MNRYEATVKTIGTVIMGGCGYDAEEAKQYRVIGEPLVRYDSGKDNKE